MKIVNTFPLQKIIDFLNTICSINYIVMIIENSRTIFNYKTLIYFLSQNLTQ